MNAGRENEEARVLSEYCDGRISRQREPGSAHGADGVPPDLDELMDLARLLGSAEIRPPAHLSRWVLAQARDEHVATCAAQPPIQRQPLMVRLRRQLGRPSSAAPLRRALAPLLAGAMGLALIAYLQQTRVSGAELLRSAVQIEAATDRRSDIVLYRSYTIEERETPSDTLVARYHVDVWRPGGGAVAATGRAPAGVREVRRVYDAERRLMAGQWRHESGGETLYQRGTAPESIANGNEPPLDSEHIWRWEMSAASFSRIVGQPDELRAARDGSRYVVAFEPRQRTGQSLLTRATLVLREDASGLHSIWQSLFTEDREFRFIETQYDRLAAAAVHPGIFVPDAELLPTVAVAPLAEAGKPVVPPVRRLDTDSVIALEFDVARRLHELGVCVDDNVSVARSGGGGLRVAGAVANTARAAKLRDTLGAVAFPDAVTIDVRSDPRAAVPSAWGDSPASASAVPVYPLFRKYFAGQLDEPPAGVTDHRIAAVTMGYAERALGRSARMVVHARALKQLADRWNGEGLLARDLDAAAAWHSMLRQHAAGIRQEVINLRLELGPVLFPGLPAADPAPDATTPASSLVATLAGDVSQAVAQLAESVRAAFVTPATAAPERGVDLERWWQEMIELERVAARFDGPLSITE